ncbi:hypothetical protein BTUL_0176g00120 [Botrytis tulipae]|uniref:Uncharacterized protein n=1 Tax=Botrytis tulipae TaxID=87230 RepID=A0A4Z1EJC8_9HELO|nr:hypothetical protein BTUL_0176g00120 [Botrytis tulipae]
MATQEELAMLFARNLSLHNPPPPPAPVEEPKEVEPTYTYSISQHYTHSAHVAKQAARPASEPPQTDQLTVDIILARHGVDSSSLYPTQIELFKIADATQQMRLIELWRICPPYNGGHALAQDLWTGPSTSLEQEESMAKLRYERQMMEERMSRTQDSSMDDDTMSDGSSHAPLTPIQGGDARWNHVEHVEPYMASGYEILAAREYEQSTGPSKDIYSHFGSAVGGPQYKQSTDPVYNNVEAVHGYPNVEAMENQYGAFQNYQFGGYTNGGEDEEML